jgi:uncharacterized protein YfaQ (DUF2300 family)
VGKKRSSDASRRYFFLYRESATDFVVVAAITTSITSWLSRTAPSSSTTTGIGNDSSTIYVCTNDLCAPWRQLSVASTTGGADIEKEREYGK